MTDPTATPTPHRYVAAVSVKLPSFWPSDVELWFSLCEAEFDICKISRQETMFGHIIRALPQEIAQEVRDLIVSRPSTDPYDELKAAIIKRTSVSEHSRLRQLLSEEELGDRKPSQLLRRMRHLLGHRNFDEGLLRQLFVQRLPLHAQAILATSKDTVPLEDVADIADRILEAPAPPPAAVAAVSRQDHLTDRIDRLEKTVNRLAERISSLCDSRKSRGRSKSIDQSERTGPPGVCWYHRKYDTAATKCVQPCNFQSGNSGAQQ